MLPGNGRVDCSFRYSPLVDNVEIPENRRLEKDVIIRDVSPLLSNVCILRELGVEGKSLLCLGIDAENHNWEIIRRRLGYQALDQKLALLLPSVARKSESEMWWSQHLFGENHEDSGCVYGVENEQFTQIEGLIFCYYCFKYEIDEIKLEARDQCLLTLVSSSKTAGYLADPSEEASSWKHKVARCLSSRNFNRCNNVLSMLPEFNDFEKWSQLSYDMVQAWINNHAILDDDIIGLLNRAKDSKGACETLLARLQEIKERAIVSNVQELLRTLPQNMVACICLERSCLDRIFPQIRE